MRSPMLFVSVCGVVAVLHSALQAQVAPSEQFEVASVRENTSGSARASVQIPPEGTVIISNATLRQIVQAAFRVPPSATDRSPTGGPEAVMSARFDIVARAPEGGGDRRVMLQSLLADRFGYKSHVEQRQMAVYALVVARPGRLGPQLKPSAVDCEAWLAARRAQIEVPEPLDSNGMSICPATATYDWGQNGELTIRRAGPVAEIIPFVRGFVGRDRPIVDFTGLTGLYEWSITFDRRMDGKSPAPSIFTAFQEQLGLRLEPRDAPIDVIVVDDVRMPDAN